MQEINICLYPSALDRLAVLFAVSRSVVTVNLNVCFKLSKCDGVLTELILYKQLTLVRSFKSLIIKLVALMSD